MVAGIAVGVAALTPMSRGKLRLGSAKRNGYKLQKMCSECLELVLVLYYPCVGFIA